MPNHIKNVLKFKNLKQDDIELILNMITSPAPDSTESKYNIIDFDKIIPEPRTIEDCDPRFVFSKEKIESGHTGVECTDDRVWFDWYNWHLNYWGTKWNAYNCYTLIGKSYITFVFNTAWSMPHPIISKLSVLGYNMELKYADEDYGSNCGEFKYTNEQGWEVEHEHSLSNPDKFARRLWDKY